MGLVELLKAAVHLHRKKEVAAEEKLGQLEGMLKLERKMRR